jgi:hypothetical protein
MAYQLDNKENQTLIYSIEGSAAAENSHCKRGAVAVFDVLHHTGKHQVYSFTSEK